MIDNNTIIISGIFLLIAIQSGGYVAELLDCQLQKKLTESMVYKHITLFIILLSVIMLIDQNYEINPLMHVFYSIIIYILYLLFIRMDLIFSLIAIGMLLILFILNHYIEYYKNNNKENKEIIEILINIRKILLYITIGIVVIGSSYYFFEKRIEYGKNWSTAKYIFGVTKCRSLK